MKPEDFITAYASALATQDWAQVEPLSTEQVSVTFSNGTVHKGKENVQKAFEHNFRVIQSEEYQIRNVQWLEKGNAFAVYLFEYYWSGLIDGKSISGNGIGTSVIVKREESWVLLAEHLGKKVV